MKAIPIGLLALSCLTGMATSPSGPAESGCKAVFAKHWQVSKEFTLAVAEAMPAEDYDFKPKPEELTFGQLTISFDKCANELDVMPPEQWNREVYKFQGQPVLANEALLYTFTHTAHHRAQAEVYLRLKNIKPPAWRF
jgi:hypothetical protein